MKHVTDADKRKHLIEEVTERLLAFGVPPNRVAVDSVGRITVDAGDMLRILEVEAQTGFRSAYALSRALDERNGYWRLGLLAIKLDLSDRCDVDNPVDLDREMRSLARTVRELDGCYRCIDTTLVMLLPEAGTRETILAGARNIRRALTRAGISALIGATATEASKGEPPESYMAAALGALIDARAAPDHVAFMAL